MVRSARPRTMSGACAVLAWCVACWTSTSGRAELPSPELRGIYPAGGQAGTSVELTVEGAALDGLAALRFSDARIRAESLGKNQFRATIPADVRPGLYDVRAVGKYGVSNPRSFVVGALADALEVEPNDSSEQAMTAALDRTLHGRIDKPADIDTYRFTARRGERTTIDLWAERLDSPLAAVVEVYDPAGRRLAVGRGGLQKDVTLVFTPPADGEYRVRVFDQTLVGSPLHLYRLELASAPRYVTAFPNVVTAGADATVSLSELSVRDGSPPRTASVTLNAAQAEANWPLLRRSWQAALASVPVASDLSAPAVAVGVTDVPVTRESLDNHRPESAQSLVVPAEVAGRLAVGEEQDWYRVEARRGEVLWIEGLSARLGAPVDLDVVILDAAQRELLHLSDQWDNAGGLKFPTAHSDPAGRFVAPADGAYWILVRNVIGDLHEDVRRVYRLSVRREDPDFHLIAIPRRGDAPVATNVWRGGREAFEVLVERRRGTTGPIRISAVDLPAGLEVPDQWIGPEQSQATIVVSAARGIPESIVPLQLVGRASLAGQELARPVQSGTIVRTGSPNGWSRFCGDFPLGVVQDAPLVVHAVLSQSSFFQGSVVDVAIDLERRDGIAAPARLTVVGLPDAVETSPVTIPAGETKGWVSIGLPTSLPVGAYSFAIQVDTEAAPAGQKMPVTTFSNSLALPVDSARIHVTVDPRNPQKIARGQVVHLKYKAERRQGFIGKIHTELAAPGGVVGIRGRGVTFTGQTETGDIQVIATENAVPGQLVFLRLEAIGTVEDQPVYRGSRFIALEITP